MVAVAVGVEQIGVEVDGLFFDGQRLHFLRDLAAGAAVEQRRVADFLYVDDFVGAKGHVRH